VVRLLEHCPLHGNGLISRWAITRQWPATTLEELLGAMFSVWSGARLYSEIRQGSGVTCGHKEL
jgi:hypothetical protein